MGIRSFFSRLFRAAGYSATASSFVGMQDGAPADPVDLGPGITGYGGEYYGRYPYADGSDGSRWQYGLSSTGSTPVLDHTLLRLNSRSAYHDSMQIRAIIDRMADLIAGDGLRLEASPNTRELGITEAQAEKWARDVEDRFDTYMKSKHFSLDGQMTGYQSQRFTITQQIRDGEYFAQLHYNRGPSGGNPLQVSFIDPIQIDGYPQTDTAGYYLTESGIQYDSRGRETSYAVQTYNPKTNEHERVVVPRVGRKSKRTLVLHGFQAEYANQKRGYPKISHIIHSAELLADFELSHIKKAAIESSIGGYVKPHQDYPASGAGMEDLVSGPASPYQHAYNPLTGGTDDSSVYTNLSEVNEVNLRPGSLFVTGLQGGEDLKPFNGSTPAENYHTFVDSYMKSMCSSISMPHELVWMNFGDSFSASRAELVLSWHVVSIWQAELAADYLNPIYEAWLSGEIAAGRISAPGWSDPRKREAWLSNSWIGFPMPNIDPSKTADAEQKYVAMGATTLDRVARQYNGSSGKINRAKLAREIGELTPVPFGKGANSKVGQDKKETKEDKEVPERPSED